MHLGIVPFCVIQIAPVVVERVEVSLVLKNNNAKGSPDRSEAFTCSLNRFSIAIFELQHVTPARMTEYFFCTCGVNVAMVVQNERICRRTCRPGVPGQRLTAYISGL